MMFLSSSFSSALLDIVVFFVVVVAVQCELEKFRRRIVSKSSFSDDEKSDVNDDETKDPLLPEDEQKEDDIARIQFCVNPLSLRILLKLKGVVLATLNRIVLRNFHELFPNEFRRNITHKHISLKHSKTTMTGGGKQPKSGPHANGLDEPKSLTEGRPFDLAHTRSASSIAMYELDMQTTKWHRKNVEGSLFVVERKKVALIAIAADFNSSS